MNTQEYFKRLETEVRKVYEVANKARAKGYDPSDKVEIPLAMSMAEKVVGLIATIYPQMNNSGISERILELEKEHGKLDTAVSFKIAEEIAKQKYCKFESVLQAIEAGIRIGFAYITLGVVSSPIEGFTKLSTRKTHEGKDYLVAYFSGPVRSAGTTASCVVLMLIDYLREMFGYVKYDPTEEEVKRYVTENFDYHERITNLQYMPTEEEIIFLAKNLPIQIDGEPTERLEVSNYKNLARVETNYIRGGMCLIFSEGLAQKAKKGFRLLESVKKKGFTSSGFDFLKEYIELHEQRDTGKKDDSPTYINDLVAGRPVFSHPSRSGGFRFRYGRGRVSGFSATSMHPATMGITDNFIAIGTQLKLEKPTKGCVVTVCDMIEGPIVKLKNGSVKKIKTMEEAEKIYSDVEEIIYLGDILFPFSDLANRNYNLIRPGYVEEWWQLELEEKNKEATKNIDCYKISFEESLRISKEYGIALNPKFIFYWTQISKEQFLNLAEWFKHSRVSGKIILPYSQDDEDKYALGKRALELLGAEHEVFTENVVIGEETSKWILTNFGIDYKILYGEDDNVLKNFFNEERFDADKEILEIINSVSEFEIKDKAGDFIGARMGRPEKSKLRKLTGSPNVLFPVGSEGGRLRSVNAACAVGKVFSSFPEFFCRQCDKETVFSVCEKCDNKTVKKYYCYECKQKSFEKCTEHERVVSYSSRNIEIKEYYDGILNKLGFSRQEAPVLVKGVRGTSSSEHSIEHLAKGILRAMYGLQVNKDGTIRIDATEVPLISFKPKEIEVGVEKLKELGYDTDVYGEELMNEEQILELKPHDIVLPCPKGTNEQGSDEVFGRVGNFIDDLLTRFYKQESFYKIKKREDLVGQLGVCMAPHNCAGVICRFIGFSKTQGLLASPYMHAAIRRDCFDYNTYIPIKENGFWRNVKIGELVEKINPEIVVDDFGTKEKKVSDFETISFDKNLKNYKIKNFTKHTKSEMFEVKTSLGKKLEVTENHKFFVDGRVKRMSELKIGDKLPLPKKINIKSEDIKEINLAEFLKNENLMIRKINHSLKNTDFGEILKKLNISKKQFMNFKLRDSYPLKFVLNLDKKIQSEIFDVGKIATKRDSVEVPIKIKLTNELLEVVGLYVAEGYSRSISSKKGLNQVYISSEDKILRTFVEKTIKDVFGLSKSENKKDRVTFSSRALYLFFTKILEAGSVAREKRIPYLFLSLPLKRLACVLRGYFEGDGSTSFSDIRVSCDSVSEGLINDIELCLSRFGIFAKRYDYEKYPGQVLKDFYIRKRREIPKFKITKLTIGSDFIKNFNQIGFLSERKKKILEGFSGKKYYGMRIIQDSNFVYDPVVSIKALGKRESYCLNVDTKSHIVVSNSICSVQCDGDEAAIMLLMDVLLNFSLSFLPSHRGGTQDAPLVLNAKIDAGEVDDQIMDFELSFGYPLELYRKAEQRRHSSEIKIPTVKSILREGKDPFVNFGFTHDTKDFNAGVICSSYKSLATMQEKLDHQMALVEKIRAADTSDTARLVIDRHFLKDMRGNLRGFSMQTFRCVECNEIVRRPPLSGVCPACRGKLIFTVNEGGIKKYLEPATSLAERYNLSVYVKQNLEMVKRYIESIFGKELEKQENINRWF